LDAAKDVEFLAEAHDLFVLLDEHGQQHDFERQQVRGVRCGRQMPARGTQQIVKGELILTAQGAAEAR
jgi:DNA polymerase II large subunit